MAYSNFNNHGEAAGRKSSEFVSIKHNGSISLLDTPKYQQMED